MSNVTRVYVKVKDIKDPKDELTIALSRFKKKLKETGILSEYLERQYFRRPAVRRRDKAEKARRRNRRSNRRAI